jgi:hypothetical protein
MKLLLACFALAALAFTLTAADTDITGKWSGSFVVTNSQGETENHTAYCVLKQSGKEITGTGGPDENVQWPIQKGTIEGNRFTGEVQSDDGPLYKLDMTVDGDRIKGDVLAVSESKTLKGRMDLSRVK